MSASMIKPPKETSMTSISILFTRIISACGEKENETGNASPSQATFIYECYDEDDLCSMEQDFVELSNEQFESYLINGELTEESCSTLCQVEMDYYDYLCSCNYEGENENGEQPITCEFTTCAIKGRGHGNIQKGVTVIGSNNLTRYVAKAYHAEASSVAAFLQLRSELQRYNVPLELLKRCLHAAKDEIKHARMIAALARKNSAILPELSFGILPNRTLFEITLDNAIEGCIYETYSALKAQYQVHHADARLIPILQTIARDETKHAQLAWDIHKHLIPRMSPKQQQKIKAAQRIALQNVLVQAMNEASGPLSRTLGYPPSDLAKIFSSRLDVA